MDELNHQLEQATVLLLACARGDAKAFQRLYRLEAPRMLALARRLSGDPELAEEALQDTFVQVWRNAVRFHPEKGSARAWLYALLRYRLINQHRRAKRDDAEALPGTTGRIPGPTRSSARCSPTSGAPCRSACAVCRATGAGRY
jgi:RNA polymerase sigma-70 factor, ECF subfamily